MRVFAHSALHANVQGRISVSIYIPNSELKYVSNYLCFSLPCFSVQPSPSRVIMHPKLKPWLCRKLTSLVRTPLAPRASSPSRPRAGRYAVNLTYAPAPANMHVCAYEQCLLLRLLCVRGRVIECTGFFLPIHRQGLLSVKHANKDRVCVVVNGIAKEWKLNHRNKCAMFISSHTQSGNRPTD